MGGKSCSPSKGSPLLKELIAKHGESAVIAYAETIVG